jgi:hypothetical protein
VRRGRRGEREENCARESRGEETKGKERAIERREENMAGRREKER